MSEIHKIHVDASQSFTTTKYTQIYSEELKFIKTYAHQ